MIVLWYLQILENIDILSTGTRTQIKVFIIDWWALLQFQCLALIFCHCTQCGKLLSTDLVSALQCFRSNINTIIQLLQCITVVCSFLNLRFQTCLIFFLSSFLREHTSISIMRSGANGKRRVLLSSTGIWKTEIWIECDFKQLLGLHVHYWQWQKETGKH